VLFKLNKYYIKKGKIWFRRRGK